MHNSCADSCAVRHVALCLVHNVQHLAFLQKVGFMCVMTMLCTHVKQRNVVNACEAEEQKCEEHNGMHVVNS